VTPAAGRQPTRAGGTRAPPTGHRFTSSDVVRQVEVLDAEHLQRGVLDEEHEAALGGAKAVPERELDGARHGLLRRGALPHGGHLLETAHHVVVEQRLALVLAAPAVGHQPALVQRHQHARAAWALHAAAQGARERRLQRRGVRPLERDLRARTRSGQVVVASRNHAHQSTLYSDSDTPASTGELVTADLNRCWLPIQRKHRSGDHETLYSNSIGNIQFFFVLVLKFAEQLAKQFVFYVHS
jgi:hypothetical protein